MKKTFGVVTTGRADRTPLTPVIAELKKTCRVFVCDVEGHTISGAAAEMHRFCQDRILDAVIILGDRFEALACANVATYFRKPIAHIHGGETTRGSFDNQIRDAITKLSNIHLVASEVHACKVQQLNEEPERIFVVGAPGLDNLTNLPPRNKTKTFIATWHPETLGVNDAVPLIAALREFPDYQVIWTEPNNDPGRVVPDGVVTFSLEDYIKACRNAAAIVGNSSAGVIEAPTMEVPSVNVGERQSGRMSGPSVFHCGAEKELIVKAIKAAIAYEGSFFNPYKYPDTSIKIASILNKLDFSEDWIIVKRL